MKDLRLLIDSYVAQWNEPDLAVRRARIRAIWAEDAMTCHRLQLWHGWSEIEERVAAAHRQWVAEEKCLFRPTEAIGKCGQTVRFIWHMVRQENDELKVAGCNYLTLDPQGRIREDYQFAGPSPATTPELADFMARYLEAWNAPDAKHRETAVRSLWADKGRHLTDTYELQGPKEITEEAHRTYDQYGSRGMKFEVSGVDGHHQASRFDWRLRSSERGPAAIEGSGFLVLDGQGRIEADYQFEPFPDIAAAPS